MYAGAESKDSTEHDRHGQKLYTIKEPETMGFFLLCAAQGAKRAARIVDYRLRVGEYPEENGEHKKALALIKTLLTIEQACLHEYLFHPRKLG